MLSHSLNILLQFSAKKNTFDLPLEALLTEAENDQIKNVKIIKGLASFQTRI